MTGDGTSSIVLLIGEFLKQVDLFITEGLHPRIISEGYEKAKEKALSILDDMKIKITPEEQNSIPMSISKTSLATKVHPNMAEQLTEIVMDAVLAIRKEDTPLDLHMVEIMEMQHRRECDTQLVNGGFIFGMKQNQKKNCVSGLVMDYGGRHPDMPKRLENCYILTCNVSLEYEKTEVNSGFFYKSAEEREKLVTAERKFEGRVQKIIALKKKVCDGTDKTFVVINQKGVDPMSLDTLAKEGIMALRRAKRYKS